MPQCIRCRASAMRADPEGLCYQHTHLPSVVARRAADAKRRGDRLRGRTYVPHGTALRRQRLALAKVPVLPHELLNVTVLHLITLGAVADACKADA